MRVRYTETALAEIDDILSRIAAGNLLAAYEVSQVLRAAIDRLARFPRSAIETDVGGVHVTPVLPYRYLVFYTVADETIVVRNIRHAARERPY